MLFPDLKELISYKQIVQRFAKSTRYQHNKTQGDYTSILHGVGVEFETLRPYVVGDDLRYVDWRTSARIGKPQVKTFRAECDRNVFIVVDANVHMRFGTRKTFKSVQAARVAAIMSWASLEEQDRVGGLVYGDVDAGIRFFKPLSSHASVLHMLDLLCSKKHNVHSPVAITQALDSLQHAITPQSAVILIADFSAANLKEVSKKLLSIRKLANVMLVPIFDHSDIEIPDAGMLRLSNNQHSAVVYTRDNKARKKYYQMWQAYQSELEKIAKKLQIKLLWLATDEDPVKKIWKK